MTRTKRAFSTQAFIVFLCAGAAFTPACGPLPEEDPGVSQTETAAESTEVGSSAITYDRNGRAYESKFERLGQKLLKQRAVDPAVFEKILADTYGNGFDRTAAEGLRQKILAGDFSWAPPVHIVPQAELGDMAGGYSEANGGIVYLSDRVPNTFLRADVYMEELGHHLERLLRVSETPGDEGARFRMNVDGEVIIPALHDTMLGDEHGGNIMVDGHLVSVEFFSLNPLDWFRAAWDGIKDAAKWLGDRFKSAASALAAYARGGWNASKKMARWIANNAEVAADYFVQYCRRSYLSVKQSLINAKNMIRDLGLTAWEGGKLMVAGIEEIAKGNFKDGAAALFIGLAKITVEAPISAFVGGVMEMLGSLQVALFLEPEGRSINGPERNLLTTIFGDQSWLSWIVVKEGWAGVFSLISDRPFTLENTIYLKNEAYSLALMAHETTHVWQWENHGGNYKLKSMWCQYFGGGGYDWQPSVSAGQPWGSLNVEQQANFVDAAVSGGYFAGMGLGAFTAQFAHAHGEILAGRGPASWSN
jgi:hypothetical protein